MAYNKLKKYFSIFYHLQRYNLMRRMAYPISFLINFCTVVVIMLFSLVFINVTFSYTNNVAGWNHYQVLAVVGSYMVIEGIMWTFLSQLNPINRHIMEGTLDGVLLKPIDDQFLVSFWKGDLEDGVRSITGIGVLIIAIKNTIGFSFPILFLFLLLLLNGLIILYSFNLFIRSISFWIIDGSGLWLLMERVTSNSQFPIDIYYHKAVRSLFTFIIPLAFIATVPGKILTFKIIDWNFIGISFLMAFVFFFGSRKFWQFSLKHYSSASS